MNYITKEETIIFSPKFDKKIDDELLLNYKKIIFSKYELTNSLFDNYENDNFKNLKLSFSYFNQKIDLPHNLTHLTFGESFNQKVDLPPNLTHLTFGWNFNQKVDLPPNLTHLTFDRHFNQEVNLPPNLIHLTFGDHFNQEVNLPHNLTHLTFGLPRKLFIIFWSLTKL